MCFKSFNLILTALTVLTCLTAPNNIWAHQDTSVRLKDLPDSIEVYVTLQADVPNPKMTLLNVPLKKGWQPTKSGWVVAGNANGGGGGSTLKRDGKIELSDDHYAHENSPPQAVVNNDLLRTWGFKTKPAVEFDPRKKLSDSKIIQFYHEVLTRGGMMTYKMKDAETVDSVRIYLPDFIYEGMGKRFSYQQFPERVKTELNNIRKAMEDLGLFNNDFWNKQVAGSEINYRFLPRSDFEKVTCEKYTPDLKMETTAERLDHQQFGCTYANSTYIVNEIYSFEKSNPREIAFALFHERLWSLKPGFAERAKVPKEVQGFAFFIETDIDERMRTVISILMMSLRHHMNKLEQPNLELNPNTLSDLDKAYIKALKNIAAKTFKFESRMP